MTVVQLRNRLDERFRLLKGACRGVERHQTLQATLAWSYDLSRPMSVHQGLDLAAGAAARVVKPG